MKDFGALNNCVRFIWRIKMRYLLEIELRGLRMLMNQTDIRLLVQDFR